MGDSAAFTPIDNAIATAKAETNLFMLATLRGLRPPLSKR
jgi:hypothetical protein